MIGLLGRTAAICMICAMLIVAMRLMGSLARPPAATSVLEAYQCSPAPCWHDIRPGETTVVQAISILRGDRTFTSGWEDPYSLFCWRSSSDTTWKGCLPFSSQPFPENPVGTVGISWPSELGLRLGDAIVLFGEPLSSQLCWSISAPVNMGGPLVTVYLHFRHNIMAAAYNPTQPKEPRFDPNMTVFRVSYMRQDDPPGAQPWRGFTVPNALGCAS